MTLGFVIVRHVNSSIANEYWRLSYQCVRKFYPNVPILIVDDNSNSDFLIEDIELVNTQQVQSEFKGCGEILGYYYFHKLHFADKAVIIHDSVFINRYIDFEQFGEVKPLWSFATHLYDDDVSCLKIICSLQSCDEIMRLYLNKIQWNGCFGIMSVIEWDFLNRINERHNFFSNILPQIKSRANRMCIERIFACLCQVNSSEYMIPPHIFGDIGEPRWNWGLSFEKYKASNFSHLPIVKVWSGR